MQKRIIRKALLTMCLAGTVLTHPSWGQQQHKKVLFIGDSITDGGWGRSGGDMRPSSERDEWDKNHVYGHGYMEQCASYYGGQYPDLEMQFWNRGISGNTLHQMAERWHEDAIALHPDVISILIGTNDAHAYLEKPQVVDGDTLAFDYAGWEAEYRQLLQATRDSLPQVKFVLCTPFVAKAGWVGEAANYPEREQIVSRLSETTRQIARDYEAELVDFNQLFGQLRTQHPTSNNSYWIWDGIHPTPAGHHQMAQRWIQNSHLLTPMPNILDTISAQAGQALTMAQLTPGNPAFLYAPSLLNTEWDEKGKFQYTLPDSAAQTPTQPKKPEGEASNDQLWRAVNRGDRLWVIKDYGDGGEWEVSDSTLTYAPIEGQSDVVWGQSVHRNEFGIDDGIFWSPSGHQLAFYRMDQSMVQSYPLVQTDEREATVNWMKYPMAGMTSHQVKLGIYDPEHRQTLYLKTGSELPDAEIPADHLTNPYQGDHERLVRDPEHYLTCISWRPDGKQIFVMELNRLQNYAEMNVYDAKTGDFIETLFSLSGDKYVEPEHSLYFLPGSNDRFVWQDERDGYDHLYLYDLSKRGTKQHVSYHCHTVDGLQGEQLTQGEWVVTDLIGADPKAKALYFMATLDSPLESNLYQLSLASHKVRRLTPDAGVHRIKMKEDYTEFYDVFSNHDTPRRCQLVKVKTGKCEVLYDAPDPYQGYARPSVEVGTLTAADGVTPLYYRLVKPQVFDPTRKYPVIVYLYNGPHAQLVTEGYQYGLPGWDCYMAQQGYVVFTIDGRGSANRGLDFEQAIWHNLGKNEGLDQMVGISYLFGQPWVDQQRVGIYGWSYGGFMATYMKLHYPEVFKVGVAGGAVLDWSRYEVMYGERYMGNPENNAETYQENAQIHHTDLLQGHHLLIHDDQDATVVPQMSIQFLNKAMKEGNTYPDFYLYPNHPHNVRGKDRIHLLTKVAEYFKLWL